MKNTGGDWRHRNELEVIPLGHPPSTCRRKVSGCDWAYSSSLNLESQAGIVDEPFDPPTAHRCTGSPGRTIQVADENHFVRI